MSAMLRARLLHTAFSRLALVAMLLMVVAPLLSRALQPVAGYAEMCTTGGLARVALRLPGAAPAMALHPGHGAMTIDTDADAGAHASHGGAACDYCLLCVRLLPVLLCLLALLPVLPLRTPDLPCRPLRADAIARRAHPPRGPPLYA